jgi:hypothetical protein
LSGFVIKLMLSLSNEEMLPLLVFGRVLSIWINSLNTWQSSPVNPCDPGLFFLRRFLITDLIRLVYFFLSLDRFYVSRNLFISLGCPICWHKIVHNSPMSSFLFPGHLL